MYIGLRPKRSLSFHVDQRIRASRRLHDVSSDLTDTPAKGTNGGGFLWWRVEGWGVGMGEG